MQKEKNQSKSAASLAISILQSDVFIISLSVLTGVIIARTLGPEMLGFWVLLSLILAYAETFGRLKTDIASVYIIGSGAAKPYEVFFSTHFFALVTSLVSVLLLFWQLDFLHDFFFSDSKIAYHLELTFLVLLIPFEFTLINNIYFLLALENTIAYNRIRVLRQVIYLIAVVLFLNLGFELMSLVIARIVEVFIALIYSFFSCDRKELLQGKYWNTKVNKLILSYAVNFYAIGLVAHIQELSVRTISAFFLNTSQVAFYSQGEGAGKIVTKLPEALTTILYPRISRLGNASEAIDLSCLAFRLVLIGLIFTGIVLSFIAKPLIVLLYGIEFEQAATVLVIAIPGIVIGSSCLTLKTFFEGSGLANFIPKVQVIPVILQVGLAYFLISLYGLIGAAISFSVGFALYGFVVLITFLKVNKVSFSRAIPGMEDFKLLYNLLMERFLSKK
ncbi:hypothetical protein N9J45_00940 [Gammaproteobacteria bacterium]|nr:hypothetical protein [Gammaproteobacteria bacterium]